VYVEAKGEEVKARGIKIMRGKSSKSFIFTQRKRSNEASDAKKMENLNCLSIFKY